MLLYYTDMPKVRGKPFPYTKAGYKAAEKERRVKKGKSKR